MSRRSAALFVAGVLLFTLALVAFWWWSRKPEEETVQVCEAIEDIWQRAEQLGNWGEAFDPEAAELVRPAVRLLRTVVKVAARRGDDPEVVDRVREILERARDEIGELRRA